MCVWGCLYEGELECRRKTVKTRENTVLSNVPDRHGREPGYCPKVGMV